MIGKAIILLFITFIFVLAVMAIVHGRKGMRMAKNCEGMGAKGKILFWLFSAIHMWAGIFIALCYIIAVVMIVISL